MKRKYTIASLIVTVLLTAVTSLASGQSGNTSVAQCKTAGFAITQEGPSPVTPGTTVEVHIHISGEVIPRYEIYEDGEEAALRYDAPFNEPLTRHKLIPQEATDTAYYLSRLYHVEKNGDNYQVKIDCEVLLPMEIVQAASPVQDQFIFLPLITTAQ